MESKYAEKALKILNSIAKPKNVKNNALLTDEVLKAMCKLANEVEKDKVNEVKKGMDCGVTLENFMDIKENDIIETYEMVEIKR